MSPGKTQLCVNQQQPSVMLLLKKTKKKSDCLFRYYIPKSPLVLPQTPELRPQQIICKYHLSYMVFSFPPTRKYDATILKGKKKRTK